MICLSSTKLNYSCSEEYRVNQKAMRKEYFTCLLVLLLKFMLPPDHVKHPIFWLGNVMLGMCNGTLKGQG